MSKLLINESPLQVLPTLAIRVGLNEAIFLQQLHFLTKDKRPGPDGLQWIRRTYAEWQKQTFPFWSTKTIERAAKALTTLNLIKVEQRDKSSRNRDNFYAIDREYYAKWEAKTGESSVCIEPDKLSASEPDNLSPSESDNLSASHKDQIFQTNTIQDQAPRARAEGIVKPALPEHLKPVDLNAADRELLLDFLRERNGMITVSTEARAINALFDGGHSTDQLQGCWLWLDSWRDCATTWQTVKKEIGSWVRKGEPGPESKNGNGSNGKQKSNFESREQRDLRLIREGAEARRISRQTALDNSAVTPRAIPSTTGTGNVNSNDRGVG